MKIAKVYGYEDKYIISENGRIFGRAGKFSNNGKEGRIVELSTSLTHNGYLRVTVMKDGVYKSRKVHTLVMESFFRERLGSEQIDHIDGNKKNNHISNLEYVTPSENVKRAVSLGLKPKRNSVVRVDRRLTDEQVIMTKYMLSIQVPYMNIKEILNIDSKALYAIRKGLSYNSIKIPSNMGNTEISGMIKNIPPS